MTRHVNTVALISLRRAVLRAMALTAVLTGMTTAKALDKQATTAEMDDALDHAAVARGCGRRVAPAAAYAYARRPRFTR